jgi:large subunit ribosomal protein L21
MAQTPYAVFVVGGKQYKASVGDTFNVELLDNEPGDTITLRQVNAIGAETGFKFGTPNVEGASVEAKVLENGKDPKITVFTYRAKKGSKRKVGHRQPYTKIRITAINA